MERSAQGGQQPGELVLAFDVGGTTVKGAAITPDLQILATAVAPTREGPAIVTTIEDVEATLRADLGADPALADLPIRAAGITMPGIVDTEAGVVRRSVNLNLRDFPIAAALRDAVAVPVGLGHDVGAAAEAVVATEPSLRDPFVVVLGTGVAAVSYVHGRALRGVSGQAGEFGHIVARPRGRQCQCGNLGCIEAYAGARGMLGHYRELGGQAELTSVRDLVAHRADDAIAAQVWSAALEVLADGLLSVCALTAPGDIVLAGGVSEAGEALRSGVRNLMQERAIVPNVPPLHLSPLGGRAGVVGAGIIAWRRSGVGS